MTITLIIMSAVALAAVGLYLKERVSGGRQRLQWKNIHNNLKGDVASLSEKLKKAEDAASAAAKESESLRRFASSWEQDANRLRTSLESHRLRYSCMVQNLVSLQRTVFTEPGQIKPLFSDFFLLYKPFDALGGDFYKITSDGDHILAACGNCGISGAAGFVKGVQNVAMLEDIIFKKGLANIQAGEILDFLRTRYAHAAERDGIRHDADEDVPVNFTVCIINQKERTLSYAGAYGSLCLIRKAYPGTSRREVDVHEFCGDKMNFAVSFGRRKNYTTETIELEKDDKLYLKTDGYANQRGGSSNARYGDQYLRQLFMKNANAPMLDQRKAYEQEFDNWRGSNRGNDILVIGLALKVAGK